MSKSIANNVGSSHDALRFRLDRVMGKIVGTHPLESIRDIFQALRAMVQANLQILQPMLQELSKQNPQLLRTIQDYHTEFLQLINDPAEGAEGEINERIKNTKDEKKVKKAEQMVKTQKTRSKGGIPKTVKGPKLNGGGGKR